VGEADSKMATPKIPVAALLLAAEAAATAAARGQASTEARNATSVDVALPIAIPISLLVGERSVTKPAQVEYQRVIADHLVLLVRAGLCYARALAMLRRRRGSLPAR
jgi:hypothetical protein